MLAPDLRLGDFIPGLLLPPESNPPILAGLLLLLTALYTLAIPTHPRTFAALRVALGVPAGYLFYVYGFHEYGVTRRNAQTGLTVVGLYGIMRVIDACLIDLVVGVRAPPRWVVGDKVAPFPTTVSGRLAFALDYLLSLRGTSMFKNTTWDWVSPSTKNRMPPPDTPKSVFLRNALWSLFKQFLVFDALDTLNKSRIWDNTLPYPVTGNGLSAAEQLAFSFSLCAGTLLSISMQFTLIASVAIACGSPVESWSPMFDAPFSATSLADFWTRRWHAVFRRVFDRLSLGILGVGL
ncbi:hypothetical protein BDV93DRAFT_526859 [Ceratobasidium sp. AG-I]|nr:hypothetical protein BDV93DRAFT_526859 [Ceratobasidium sp. AG-I]